MNYFKYEDTFYHQIKGTAMGSNLFTGKFEVDFVYTNISSVSFGLLMIFFIFSGTVEQLNQFHDFLNSRLDSISFMLEYDISSIALLDVCVYRSIGQMLQTLVYCKPTDRHNFLHSNSYHPSSVKKSLPYSQFFMREEDL